MIQETEKLPSDINDSYTALDATLHSLDTSLHPDLPENDDSEISDNKIEALVDQKKSMASKLSDEDINRIAQAVRSIMVPDMKAIIDKRVDALKTDYDGKIKVLQNDNNELQTRIYDLEAENADLKGDLADMQNEIDGMKWRSDELEQYSRRNSFRISGVYEDDRRSTDEITMDIANKYNIDVNIKDIDRSHRVGV